MLDSNPFDELIGFLSPLFMQLYIILMIALVAAGTLFDVWHKHSIGYQNSVERSANFRRILQPASTRISFVDVLWISALSAINRGDGV